MEQNLLNPGTDVLE